MNIAAGRGFPSEVLANMKRLMSLLFAAALVTSAAASAFALPTQSDGGLFATDALSRKKHHKKHKHPQADKLSSLAATPLP
jgi:hypothetical protein